MSEDDISNVYGFPQLPPEKLSQLWEVTSIHGAKKASSVHSHLRKKEIVQTEEPTDIEEYEELLSMRLEDPKIQVLRIEGKTDKFTELVDEGLFEEWPGPGFIFKMTCAPAHRSDTDRSAYKTPHIFLLDSADPNLLNCSDVYKQVASVFCKNCPSTNGSISSCCHIAFLVMWLSARYMLEKSVNRSVRIVNIKNPYDFMHPDEILAFANTIPIPHNVERTSKEKRPNDALYGRSKYLYRTEADEGADDSLDSDQPNEDLVPENAEINHCEQVAGPMRSTQTDEINPQIEPEIAVPTVQAADARSTTQSETGRSSIASSLYGQGVVSDIENYIQKQVRKCPRLTIPEVSNFEGLYRTMEM